MKKIILISFCLLTFTTVTDAQQTTTTTTATSKHGPKSTPEQRAQKNVDELNSEVTLTEDQKPKMYDLALTKAKKMDEIRLKYKNQPESREAAKKEMDAVRKEYRDKTKTVLSAEQLAKLKTKHQERKSSTGKPTDED